MVAVHVMCEVARATTSSPSTLPSSFLASPFDTCTMQSGDEQLNVDLLWVESVCDDDMLIEKNIKETKLFSPDYKGMKQEEGACTCVCGVL